LTLQVPPLVAGDRICTHTPKRRPVLRLLRGVAVYEGVRLAIGKKVAIKIVSSELAANRTLFILSSNERSRCHSV